MKLLLLLGALFASAACEQESVMSCYYTNWAIYRPGQGAVVPEDIADLADVCTHLIYAFAGINEGTSEIEVTDPTADLCPGDPGAEAWSHCGIKKITDLKNGHPSLKILIAVGGAGSTDIFSKISKDVNLRSKFVASVVPFLRKHNFDGLDMDWEYPKYPDKGHFVTLLSELADVLHGGGLLLTAAVPVGKDIIDAGYDVPSISKHVDLIHVMAYDYHGAWAPTTHHNAPLYQHHTDFNEYLTVDYSIHYWLSKGAPADKLILGLPMYGRCWTLDDYLYHHGIGAPGTPGPSGPNSATPGLLFYSEICKDQKNHQGDWTIVNDEEMEVPYGYRNKVWCGYDHEESIANKAVYAHTMGLRGVMAWAVDQDDAHRDCSTKNFPLTKMARNAFDGPLITTKPPTTTTTTASPSTTTKPPSTTTTTASPLTTTKPPSTTTTTAIPSTTSKPPPATTTTASPSTTTKPPPATTTTASPMTTTKPSSTTTASENTTESVMSCYYTNWAIYRQDLGAVAPEDITDLADVCTHLIYAFAGLNEDTGEIKVTDPIADLCPGDPGAEAWSHCGFKKITDLKNNHPSLKILLAVGGADSGAIFSKISKDENLRSKFVASVVPFLHKHNFDGLDMDWEYPLYPDQVRFVILLSELADALHGDGLLLTAAVPVGKSIIDSGYDVPNISVHVDLLHVMAYDYHMASSPNTHHNAPLYKDDTDHNDYLTVNYSIHYWLSKGAPADKLVLGLPMYGRCWGLDDLDKHGIGAPGTPGPSGPYSAERGILFYSEICKHQKNHQGEWTIVNDEEMEVPYGYWNKVWCGYDHEESIANKAVYAHTLGLRGVMVWAVDQDDAHKECSTKNFPLTRMAKEAFTHTSTTANPDWSSSTESSNGTTATATSLTPRGHSYVAATAIAFLLMLFTNY